MKTASATTATRLVTTLVTASQGESLALAPEAETIAEAVIETTDATEVATEDVEAPAQDLTPAVAVTEEELLAPDLTLAPSAETTAGLTPPATRGEALPPTSAATLLKSRLAALTVTTSEEIGLIASVTIQNDKASSAISL